MKKKEEINRVELIMDLVVEATNINDGPETMRPYVEFIYNNSTKEEKGQILEAVNKKVANCISRGNIKDAKILKDLFGDKTDFTVEEKEAVIKYKLQNYPTEDVIKLYKKLFGIDFTDEEVKYKLYILAVQLKNWYLIKKTQTELQKAIGIPSKELEEIFSHTLIHGDIESVAEIWSMLDKRKLTEYEEERIVKLIEHNRNFAKALKFENLFKVKLSMEYLTVERNAYIAKCYYDDALTIAKITNQPLTESEMVDILKTLISRAIYSKEKEDELKEFEINFSVDLVKKEKLSYIKVLISNNDKDSLKAAKLFEYKFAKSDLIKMAIWTLRYSSKKSDAKPFIDEMNRLYGK